MLLLIALITSSTNGYDGSMMNGLQALTNWKNKARLASSSISLFEGPLTRVAMSCSAQFNDPSGGTKGLLNAVSIVS